MKDELGEKIMTKFVRLRVKSYYLWLLNRQRTKICLTKRKLKFENYKNCLEATQLENKINYLEKNKINIDSLKKS